MRAIKYLVLSRYLIDRTNYNLRIKTMKLLVIGSTGRTGKHVVEQGLQRGHQITAFSRRPKELTNVDKLAGVVTGDALNLDDVRKAVQGQEGVIMAGGGSGIVRNLIIAMREEGAQRLVITSSRSVTLKKPRWMASLVWWFFREAYSDLCRAEGMLEFSGLDWSIARATMLNDRPFTGQVHIDFEDHATGGDWQLTRADYAMTLLDTLENPRLSGKALGVGGAKPSVGPSHIVRANALEPR
jgi:putative NADH-flavin reductase